ncbi:MAG: hypothetical protein M3P27_02895 [Acidobacteriota bacterium]|nr:hypothetical protein [Acidobacteriota bacterium]
MDRALEYLGYMRDVLPSHLVLNAVHFPDRKKRSVSSTADGEDGPSISREMAHGLGAPKRWPNHLREVAEWAEKELSG